MTREIGTDWTGRTWACACGRTHAIPTVEAAIDESAPDRAAAFATRTFPGRIALVADTVTYQVQGRDVEEAVKRESGLEPRLLLLEPVAEPEIEIADRLAGQAGDVAGLVAVGSGTVNDFAKIAAGRRNLPYVCVATAASVNGYTSSIAAPMVNGLKSTAPCPPPAAVFASPSVLADAPAALTASGFADLLSKPACQADWVLSRLLLDEWHCSEPGRIVNRAIDGVVDQAAAIGRHEPTAVCDLFEALVLSGFSMTVAGGSAPASGGEHLVSHYWDMMIPKTDLFERLHGLQVGVGTLASLAVYETVLATVDAGTWTPAPPPAWAGLEEALRAAFGPLAGAVLPEARTKRARTIAAPEWRARLAEQLESALAVVRRGLMPRVVLRDLIHDAGAACAPADLGLRDGDLVDALRFCRHLRNRFTIFDLAAALGIDPIVAGVA